MKSFFVFICFTYFLVNAYAKPRPVVLWHGMGDTCCFPFSMGAISDAITEALPGTYVYSVMIGENIISDEIQGFLSNSNDQVDFVCKTVKADPNLKDGFNAVGFSQGGQFLRALVERCNGIKVHNLITMGGQHQGVADIPDCLSPNDTICGLIESLLAFGAYDEFVQDHVIQAQYFKDPMDIPTYLDVNILIADINNERKNKSAQYKQNLLSLNSLVLYQFTEDTVVVPRESEWFGYFKDGDLNTLLTMQELPIYQEDWIGLKTLDESKRLILGKCPGDHMQFTITWFSQNVITPYLNNTIQL